jgi:hypothetical protein
MIMARVDPTTDATLPYCGVIQAILENRVPRPESSPDLRETGAMSR